MISSFLTHSIEKQEKPPASDPQRTRVYRTEREFIGVSVSHVVSKANLQVIADHVSRYYRLPKIKIIVVDRPWEKVLGWCEYMFTEDDQPIDFVIHLNRGFHGASVCILLHELAHYVTDSVYKDHEVHGPEFVAVYMHLLDKYRVMPDACYRLLAKKHRVKIASKFKPDAIRG